MTVEFRPERSPSFNKVMFPDGAIIETLGFFTDGLPRGFSTEPYRPRQYPSGANKDRYFIEPFVKVGPTAISMNDCGKEPPLDVISHVVFEQRGLPVFLRHERICHIGRLHPVSPERKSSG